MRGAQRKKPSPRTPNLNLVLWRAFTKWARKRGLLEDDPTWSQPKREPRVLAEDEVTALLEASRKPYGVLVERHGSRPYAKEVEFSPPEHLYPVITCALTSLLCLSKRDP